MLREINEVILSWRHSVYCMTSFLSSDSQTCKIITVVTRQPDATGAAISTSSATPSSPDALSTEYLADSAVLVALPAKYCVN